MAINQAELSAISQLERQHVDQLDTDLASEVCAFPTWSIGAYSDNPVTAWSALADSHEVRSSRRRGARR